MATIIATPNRARDVAPIENPAFLVTYWRGDDHPSLYAVKDEAEALRFRAAWLTLRECILCSVETAEAALAQARAGRRVWIKEASSHGVAGWGVATLTERA